MRVFVIEVTGELFTVIVVAKDDNDKVQASSLMHFLASAAANSFRLRSMSLCPFIYDSCAGFFEGCDHGSSPVNWVVWSHISNACTSGSISKPISCSLEGFH